MPYTDAIDRSGASALMPEEVAKDIIQALPTQSFALSMFRRVTMGRKQQRMPVLSALPTSYWVTGDTGLRQTTKEIWANKYLNAEELAVIVPVPIEVLDDSEFDIWGEVKPRVVESIGQTVDAAVFFGTNAPSTFPTGIVPGAVAAGNFFHRGSVVGQDVAEDINQVMKKVEEDGFDVNGFCARVGMKSDLRGLRDKNERPIFLPSLTADTPSTLYGESIFYSKNASWDATQADLVGGDITQAILGIRTDINWTVLTEATLQDNTGAIIYNLAQQRMVAMMVTFRLGFQIANPLTKLNTNDATRYPFSVLQPV